MATQVITLLAGTDKDLTVTAYNGDGTVYTGFLVSDTPSAFVYAGDDQGVLITPSASWVTNGTDGQIRVQFLASNTASVTPSRYVFRVYVTRASDSRIIPVFQSFLEVGDSPGTATALSTYCTYDDLLMYAPWLAELQTTSNEAGFADHRHRARQWLDNIIQKRARNFISISRYWNGASYGPNLYYPLYFNYGDNAWLQTQLDANCLMVKPPIVEATAYRSIATICQSRIGPGDKSSYQRLAREFGMRADAVIMSSYALLDFNSDGVSDMTVPLGMISIR